MFTDFDPTQYGHEVRERWGHTEAHRESSARTAAYGEADWAEIRAEAEAIEADFAAAMNAGEPAVGDTARSVTQRHRKHIARWFYALSPSMHRNLAEMYIADPRFTAHYGRRADGLAVYVREAILASAEAQESRAPVSR